MAASISTFGTEAALGADMAPSGLLPHAQAAPAALRRLAVHPGHAEWLASAVLHGGRHWVGNAPCEVETMGLAGALEPVTLLDGWRGGEAYTLSLRSAWLDYPAHEARRLLPPAARWAGAAALPLITRAPRSWMAVARLDRAAVLFNRLASTNLYPQLDADDWRAAVAAATHTALRRYPDRPLAWRSVCPAIHPGLAQALHAAGWMLVPARRVWLCDPADAAVWKRNNVRNDKRLMFRPEFDWVRGSELHASDLPALRACFEAVFSGKHSPLNPDFTPAFFDLCRRGGPVELLALRYQGQWMGVLGLDARHGWLTSPLLGYDTRQPQALALYRRLMARLLHEARERGLKLHYSSGADAFKAARGGEPQMEYTALYTGHLPAPRDLAARGFARVMGALVPWALDRA